LGVVEVEVSDGREGEREEANEEASIARAAAAASLVRFSCSCSCSSRRPQISLFPLLREFRPRELRWDLIQGRRRRNRERQRERERKERKKLHHLTGDRRARRKLLPDLGELLLDARLLGLLVGRGADVRDEDLRGVDGGCEEEREREREGERERG